MSMACRVQYSVQNSLRLFSLSSSSPIIHTSLKSQRVRFRNPNYGALYCTFAAADPFILTTPLYYVNAPPHMGSAYTTIAADAIARFQRLLGKKVIFITGTDEHGEKISSSAADIGLSPSEHCDYISQSYKALWTELGISYDKFIRTTDPNHEAIVKEFYSKVLASGDIYRADYEGLYCVNCEEYKDEKELLDNNCCPMHLKPCVHRKEDNYFFALSKYQKRLEHILAENPDFVQPSFRLNEVQGWVKSGLKDFSISRASVSWGIPVPNYAKQTIYRMEDETRQELEEEFYETIRVVLLALQALLQVLKDLITFVSANEFIEQPIRRPISAKGYDYIQEILKGDPILFRDMHRMYPNIFLKFCAIIREKTPLQDTRYICVEEMVATFLLTVGQNSRYCTTRERFGRAHSTTSRNFNKVLKALNTIAPDMMAKPGSVVPSKIKESTRFYPYFKDCIGAIDGTHILAQVSGRDVSSYRNRHGKISQNVLAACNFDLQFIYILSGWEGSAHDSKLLNDALVRRNGLKVPRGKFFLVDCGFANRRQFLAPFRGVRYHLKDFGGEGRHPENSRELFNLRHSSLRNVVERLFGIFKSRFAIFKSAPPFPFKTQAELVLACAGLHNFLRKECRSDEFPIEEDEDDLSDIEDDIDNDDILVTQEQQREHANEWRNNLASNMWNDAMNDDNRDG